VCLQEKHTVDRCRTSATFQATELMPGIATNDKFTLCVYVRNEHPPPHVHVYNDGKVSLLEGLPNALHVPMAERLVS